MGLAKARADSCASIGDLEFGVGRVRFGHRAELRPAPSRKRRAQLLGKRADEGTATT